MSIIRLSDAEGHPQEYVTKDSPFPVEVVEGERLPLSGGTFGQTISTTAVPLTDPPGDAVEAEIYVRTASVVFTRTGIAPTATRGFQADPGDIIMLYSRSEILGFRAIRQGGTDATVDPEYFDKVAS